MTGERRKSQDDIAGPHVGAGQARFGQLVRQGGHGLRRRHSQRRDAVDQGSALNGLALATTTPV
jgi:hypothetical protein